MLVYMRANAKALNKYMYIYVHIYNYNFFSLGALHHTNTQRVYELINYILNINRRSQYLLLMLFYTASFRSCCPLQDNLKTVCHNDFQPYHHLSMNYSWILFKGAIWQLFVENQPLQCAAEHIILCNNNVIGHGEDFGHICSQPLTDRIKWINEFIN